MVTVAELMGILGRLPGEARIVVPTHGAFRDADCLEAKLILDGAGPGAHRLVPPDAADSSTVEAAIICTRAKAAELREDI